MRIEAHINNPVIHNQEHFNELDARLRTIDPNLDKIVILKDKVVIENICRRTFRFPATPTIDWVVGRLQWMVENGL